ncbi:MAG: hypothetical protein JNN03_18955 [Rubrivivax sp.]|nr:hypothetical protein [Rubrivivax sp.]
MFTVIRTFLRYAGRIGWYDGRREYPGEEHYQEMVLHKAPAHAAAADEAPVADMLAAEVAAAESPLPLRMERS